jgi:hypothetical protein
MESRCGDRFVSIRVDTVAVDRLWCTAKVHYNPDVQTLRDFFRKTGLLASFFIAAGIAAWAQQATQAPQAPPAPAASGARILLLPREIVAGERATLAVLDMNGRLTPGVTVVFSNGDKFTTNATGRAMFVAPLNIGTISGRIQGRSGRVSSAILSLSELPANVMEVGAAPRAASVSDRFELMGHGFCGDADGNRVTIAGVSALVLASSPAYLVVLPPIDMDPGPKQVQVSCGQKTSVLFTVVFVNLVLEANSAPLAPGEHRTLTVHVHGSTAKINLEARNLAEGVAELQGGATVRAASTGGAENVAKFELVGKKRGSFVISIRLLAPLGAPRI